MPNCSVFCCKKRSETSNLKKDDITFHLFPKDDPNRRKIWIKACGNHVTWVPKRTSTICSEHFDRSVFTTQSNNKRKLNDTAIPTLKLLEMPLTQQIADGQSPSTDEIYACASSENQQKLVPVQVIKVDFTPRERKLQNKLDLKNKKIKRLQAKILYLRKKVADLQKVTRELRRPRSMSPISDDSF